MTGRSSSPTRTTVSIGALVVLTRSSTLPVPVKPAGATERVPLTKPATPVPVTTRTPVALVTEPPPVIVARAVAQDQRPSGRRRPGAASAGWRWCRTGCPGRSG